MDIAKAFVRQDGADSSRAFQWRGWGTSLKPAHEPILLCQKPLEDTYCANLDAWGCGGLNVDGCLLFFYENYIKNLQKIASFRFKELNFSVNFN